MDKIFIISGTHQEFDNWRKFNHNPVDKWYQNIVYVDNVSRLKGYHNPHGRFIGTWYRRKDIEELVLQLQISCSMLPKQAQDIINEYKSRQKNP